MFNITRCISVGTVPHRALAQARVFVLAITVLALRSCSGFRTVLLEQPGEFVGFVSAYIHSLHLTGVVLTVPCSGINP